MVEASTAAPYCYSCHQGRNLVLVSRPGTGDGIWYWYRKLVPVMETSTVTEPVQVTETNTGDSGDWGLVPLTSRRKLVLYSKSTEVETAEARNTQLIPKAGTDSWRRQVW